MLPHHDALPHCGGQGSGYAAGVLPRRTVVPAGAPRPLGACGADLPLRRAVTGKSRSVTAAPPAYLRAGPTRSTSRRRPRRRAADEVQAERQAPAVTPEPQLVDDRLRRVDAARASKRSRSASRPAAACRSRVDQPARAGCARRGCGRRAGPGAARARCRRSGPAGRASTTCSRRLARLREHLSPSRTSSGFGRAAT